MIDYMLYISTLPSQYILYKVRRDEIDTVMREMLNLILSDSTYSIVASSTEISLLVDASVTFNGCSDVISYMGIEISTSDSKLSETGLLSEVCEFFDKLNIPILCVSSYSSNCIYYESINHQKIVNALQSHDNITFTE